MILTKALALAPLLALLLVSRVDAQIPRGDSSGTADHHFLFSYFEGNGEDGLHLAYSRDGLTWQALRGDSSFLAPTVGKDRLMRDPSIVLGPDSVYHMVWTSGWNDRGIGYASSSDLMHWSEQRSIPVMERTPGTLNCWAPEIFYDGATGEYLIFWASTVPGRFPHTDGQDANASSPGWNHRIYYVKTRDFKSFTPAQILYDHGFNAIDAAILADGGRYAMLVKDETNEPFTPQKNIRITFSGHAEGPYGPPSAPITGDYWAEGPTPLEIDGKWYVYFDKYTQHQYGVVVSTDLQNWTDESDSLTMPAGMRHGTAFRVPARTASTLLRLYGQTITSGDNQ